MSLKPLGVVFYADGDDALLMCGVYEINFS